MARSSLLLPSWKFLALVALMVVACLSGFSDLTEAKKKKKHGAAKHVGKKSPPPAKRGPGNGKSSKCNPPCATCTNTDPNFCKSCVAGLYSLLVNNKCVPNACAPEATVEGCMTCDKTTYGSPMCMECWAAGGYSAPDGTYPAFFCNKA